MSLSLRTINAPGVEIKETDRSQYTQTPSGTKVLVVGYADKGEDFETLSPTTRSSLINIYGTPTNEAERYFFEGCKEVIQQGGVLYSAKLAYDNGMAEKYCSLDFSLEAKDAISGTSISGDIGDDSITSYSAITTSGIPTLLSSGEYDEFLTGEKTVTSGTIKIVDITRGVYGKTSIKGVDDQFHKECIGVVPVITTAANAMFTQMLLAENARAENFRVISEINTLDLSSAGVSGYGELSNFTIVQDDIAIKFGGTGTIVSDSQAALCDSITSRANAYFPAITLIDDKFDREFLKHIGVVVFKAYIDPTANNKINFEVAESFVGTLDPLGKDPASGINNFIDTVVNTQSSCIRIFSNAKPADDVDILFVQNQPTGSLGFYESMAEKKISFASLISGLNKIFDRNAYINEKEIDIVLDGGVSTIASFLSGDTATVFDPCAVGHSQFTLQKGKANWKAVLEKLDNFCKNTRKDCMFVADGMRQFCLDGKRKIVRPSKPSNTIDTKIIPNLLSMQVLNTNYGAGYCDWFEVVDEFSGNTFWCPPSIKAMGVYINTDKTSNFWDAPAGINRGLVSASDIAFNPTVAQAGPIYLKNWNYATSYPDAGIVLEGQKTMQVKPSAFDRVNVRRLFLRLERFVYQTARYFIYEPNTQYTRNRFVDAITPYFSQVKTAGGMYDFKIICDESINTPEVIDNNELRIRIGVKPTKTIEFIMVEFVAAKTGDGWQEITNI